MRNGWLPENWHEQVNNALKQAVTNLDSIPAPAGEMDVVLGPGWPGILLHEAVGHGWKAISTAKKPRPFLTVLASASLRPVSR